MLYGICHIGPALSEPARRCQQLNGNMLTLCADNTPPYYLYWTRPWGPRYKGCGWKSIRQQIFGQVQADGFQALILSANYTETHLPDRRYIKVSTYGILFVGTPHQGAEGVTWGILARNLASIFTNTNGQILEHLAKNSEWLEYQQTLFLPISSQFETVYFYETYLTPLLGGGSLLVCSSQVIAPGVPYGCELTVTF